MKNIVKRIAWALLPLLTLAACSQEEYESVSESGLPKIANVTYTVSVSYDSVTFHVDNKEVVPIWIFSNGDTIARNDYIRTYAVPGTYSVELKVYNKNGISDGSVTGQFTVEHTPTLTYLAGASSKTWMWDYTVSGHFGCGPSGGTGLSWWSCGANGKSGTGMYDDELTFTTNLVYTFNPGADSLIYVNSGSGYKTAYYGNDGNDYNVPCSKSSTTFNFEQDGTTLYLVFPSNTIISYIPNQDALTTPKYKILTLNDTLLDMTVDNGSIAWHYRFIPKDSKK